MKRHLPEAKISWLDYIAITLVIISSGTVVFYVLNAGITLSVYFLSSLCVFIFNQVKVKFNCFIITYYLLLLISFLLYGYDVKLIGDVMFLMATSLLALSTPYYIFRKAFLNVVVVLGIVSLMFQFLFFLNLITPHLMGIGKNGLNGYFVYGLHVFGGGHVFEMHQRLCGLFWEPGIYQIVLNLALLMNLDLLDGSRMIRWRIFKLSIIVVCIILTQSTSGYLILGITMIGYYMSKSIKSLKYQFILVIAIFVFAAIIVTSSVIVDKFSDDNASYIVRSNDIGGLVKAILARPLFGSGIDTPLFAKLSFKYELTNSLSAGFLLQTAQFGIFWLITYYYSLIQEYKRKKIQIPLFLYISVITIMGMSEPLAFTAIFLINVVPFKNYEQKNMKKVCANISHLNKVQSYGYNNYPTL